MDYLKQLGSRALGSRIKNLGDLLMKDMVLVYQENDIDFEPRWFTTFQLILDRREVAVTEISRELGQSHPAAVQVVNALGKKKLITVRTDDKDRRRRLVRLSPKGKKLAEKLAPLWEDAQAVADELISQSAPDILEKISMVEKALAMKSTYQRIKEKRTSGTSK